jgi:hypothetical protein
MKQSLIKYIDIMKKNNNNICDKQYYKVSEVYYNNFFNLSPNLNSSKLTIKDIYDVYSNKPIYLSFAFLNIDNISFCKNGFNISNDIKTNIKFLLVNYKLLL